MPLRNALPLAANASWSTAVPVSAQSLITQWDMDEQAALAAPPDPDLAWADVGTHTIVGSGIGKMAHSLPSSLDFVPFVPGDTRRLQTFSAVVTSVYAGPKDLSFGIPMIMDTIGNGYRLMSDSGQKDERGSPILIDFLGISGAGAYYVKAGRHHKRQLTGDIFFRGMYCTTSGGNWTLSSPTALAYGGDSQGTCNNGVALFTDGSGTANSVGDQHFANARNSGSARFKNVFAAYGEFSANYGRSLQQMTQVPDAALANAFNGAHCTDTLIPSYMRDKAWRMLVQSLTMQTQVVGGNGVAAATTNPYAIWTTDGKLATEETWLGQTIATAFGPKRFWVASALDSHPYALANPNTNGAGVPGDMWVNICAAPGRATYIKLMCNSREFIPVFRMYGPGDPLAEHQRMMRIEGNLDAGAAGGAPGEAQVFFQV